MATLREIRQRIRGVKNTQKITRAMKMVAAAKMRRAQDNMFSARPYSSKIKELILNLVQQVEGYSSPLLDVRPVERELLVVVSADRGLCGAFNTNLIKAATTAHRESQAEVSLVCVGKKGHDFFKKRDYQIIADHTNIFNNLDYAIANDITRFLTNEFVEGRTDSVKLIFNEFKSVAQQQVVVEQLLPISLPEDDAEGKRHVDYLYEPSLERLLQALLPKYLGTQVWRALLESNASEQAARMLAMENATENATELIRDLTLQFNKARQASITTEILEIVGGAEALKNG